MRYVRWRVDPAKVKVAFRKEGPYLYLIVTQRECNESFTVRTFGPLDAARKLEGILRSAQRKGWKGLNLDKMMSFEHPWPLTTDV